jgi:hypothetical protein
MTAKAWIILGPIRSTAGPSQSSNATRYADQPRCHAASVVGDIILSNRPTPQRCSLAHIASSIGTMASLNRWCSSAVRIFRAALISNPPFDKHQTNPGVEA